MDEHRDIINDGLRTIPVMASFGGTLSLNVESARLRFEKMVTDKDWGNGIDEGDFYIEVKKLY